MRLHGITIFAQVLSCILCLSACGQVGPLDVLNSITPEDEYRLAENLSYGDHPRQALDLYQPLESNGGPLVVFVYGGAWRDGSREEYKFVGQALATEGYTVAIPDYRLYPQVQYPSIIDDLRDAVIFLRQSAADYSLPSDRIVLAGHSSGAHAAALLVSSERYFKGEDFIVGLIGISGPYDLPLDNAEVGKVFTGIDDPAQVKPPELADSAHPPALLLHGSDDKRVVPRHTERYSTRLQTAGVPVETVLLEDVGHIGIIAGLSTRLEFLNETRELVLNFLSGLR